MTLTPTPQPDPQTKPATSPSWRTRLRPSKPAALRVVFGLAGLLMFLLWPDRTTRFMGALLFLVVVWDAIRSPQDATTSTTNPIVDDSRSKPPVTTIEFQIKTSHADYAGNADVANPKDPNQLADGARKVAEGLGLDGDDVERYRAYKLNGSQLTAGWVNL